jgi:hypothetical protein
MGTWWTNFAKYGDPIAGGSAVGGVARGGNTTAEEVAEQAAGANVLQWPQYSKKSRADLVLRTATYGGPVVENEYNEEKCTFWQSLIFE